MTESKGSERKVSKWAILNLLKGKANILTGLFAELRLMGVNITGEPKFADRILTITVVPTQRSGVFTVKFWNDSQQELYSAEMSGSALSRFLAATSHISSPEALAIFVGQLSSLPNPPRLPLVTRRRASIKRGYY